MTATVEKFLFETSFDAEAPAAEPATEDAPLQDDDGAAAEIYTEADLEAAREEAYAAGRTAGLEEDRAAAERALAASLEAIGASLDGLLAARAEAEDFAQRQALEAAMLVLRRLYPELERRHGLGEIEGVVTESLERLREEPRVVVRVADARMDELQARVEDLAARSGYPGKVVLLAEDGLSPGDARVEWADGGAERDSARLWQEVEDALARALPDAGTAGADAAAKADAGPSSNAGGTTSDRSAPPGAAEESEAPDAAEAAGDPAAEAAPDDDSAHPLNP